MVLSLSRSLSSPVHHVRSASVKSGGLPYAMLVDQNSARVLTAAPTKKECTYPRKQTTRAGSPYVGGRGQGRYQTDQS